MLALDDNKIYSTCGSGASRFAEFVSKFSIVECSEPSVIDNNVALISQAVNENSAIYFAEPAVLLKRLYQYLKNTNKITGSFRSFYEADNQVSAFFRALQNIEITQLFVLIDDDRLLKSLMIYEDYCTEGFGKILYGQLFTKKLVTLVDDEERQRIQQIYKHEYKVYQALLSTFEQQWDSFSQAKNIEEPNSKNIFIHVGPPKTGTSALQRWLCDNIGLLSQHNIFYPKHSSDSNGISSGNLSYLLSFTEEGKVYFDRTKSASNISKFRESSESSLLLSSELFYYFLPSLFTSLPKAKYIFYIRHPIALLESGYHQQVKRHGRADSFQIPNHVSFTTLKVIAHIAHEFNINVDYRYFDTVKEHHGSIYHDFASCFSSFIAPLTSENRVNTKYSAGALELMSYANKFATSYLKGELDLWLQKESESADDFSLIPPEKLTVLNKKLLVEADTLAEKYPNISFSQMVNLIQAYQPAKYFSRSDIETDFYQLLSKLKCERPLLAYTLLACARKHKENEAYAALDKGMNVKFMPKWLCLSAEYIFKLSLVTRKIRIKLRRVLRKAA